AAVVRREGTRLAPLFVREHDDGRQIQGDTGEPAGGTDRRSGHCRDDGPGSAGARPDWGRADAVRRTHEDWRDAGGGRGGRCVGPRVGDSRAQPHRPARESAARGWVGRPQRGATHGSLLIFRGVGAPPPTPFPELTLAPSALTLRAGIYGSPVALGPHPQRLFSELTLAHSALTLRAGIYGSPVALGPHPQRLFSKLTPRPQRARYARGFGPP